MEIVAAAAMPAVTLPLTSTATAAAAAAASASLGNYLRVMGERQTAVAMG